MRNLKAGGATKDWSNNLPPWTAQYSVMNRVDAMDCLSESIGNIIYMITGFDSSPRFTAKMSGTTVNGNMVENVVNSINRDGLVPYPLWPTPDINPATPESDFYWQDYYASIPQAVRNQAIRAKVQMIPADLNKSPLWTILRFPNGVQHGVAQINATHYFDSEWGDPVKPLTYGGAIVVSQRSIKVTLMIQARIARYADNKTMAIIISTPNGDQIIKATNEEQFRSWHKPDSYGKPTVNPDGSTNWDCVEVQLPYMP